VSIGGGRNAGLLAVRILAAADDGLRASVVRFQEALAQRVVDRDRALQDQLDSEE
jgi:5-(carboxyamino)imidazole ribonucleotide mutase